MFNVNRVTLLGNAVRDAEAHQTKSGRPVTTLDLGTSRSWTDADGNRQSASEYHRLVCWGGLAGFAAERLRKGNPLYVEGRLHTSRWETPDGKDASRTEVVVDRLVLLGGKKTTDVEAAEAPAGDNDIEEIAA